MTEICHTVMAAAHGYQPENYRATLIYEHRSDTEEVTGSIPVSSTHTLVKFPQVRLLQVKARKRPLRCVSAPLRAPGERGGERAR